MRWDQPPTSPAPASSPCAIPAAALSPFNSFLIIQGLQTLSLRMERHVGKRDGSGQTPRKRTPRSIGSPIAGLESSPYYELAQKYTDGKPSALLTFGIKGGFDAGVKFYDALKVFKRLVNIGDAKSLAAHPASTTHRQLTPEEQLAVGRDAGYHPPLRRH